MSESEVMQGAWCDVVLQYTGSSNCVAVGFKPNEGAYNSLRTLVDGMIDVLNVNRSVLSIYSTLVFPLIMPRDELRRNESI